MKSRRRRGAATAPPRWQGVSLAIILAALGTWLLIWSGRTLWSELSALCRAAPLVELRTSAASGFPAGLCLLALLVTLSIGLRSARWRRLGVAVAVGALPLVLILPAIMLVGGGGYLAAKGYVDCPAATGSQRFPVVRKVRQEARALCTLDEPVR